MATITNSSNSSLMIARESSAGVVASPATYQALRFTGTTLEPSYSTEMSDEINKNRSVTDTIRMSTEAGGDTSHEISYGDDFKLLFEAIFAGRFDNEATNVLKAGIYDDSYNLIKNVANAQTIMPFRYNNCKVDSATFNIGADAGKTNMSITWTAAEEELLSQYIFFTKASAEPDDHFGREGAICVTEDDGELFQYSNGAWTAIDTTYVFTVGATWTVSELDPSVAGSDGDWHLNKADGSFWFYNVDTWEEVFTVKPTNTTWYSGTIDPSSGTIVDANRDDLYFYETDSTIWQFIFNGTICEWVKVIDPVLTSIPTGLYYQQLSITNANTTAVFSFPEVRNYALTFESTLKIGSGETFCADDYTFTVTNNTERVKGLCTEQVGTNLGSIGTTMGRREISGNLGDIVTGNPTLYKMLEKGTPFSFEVTISNGTSGYKMTIPKCKLTGGNINPTANNEVVKAPYTWQALYDASSGTDFYITEIPSI